MAGIAGEADVKMPEHMDSADLGGHIPTDDDARAWCESKGDAIRPDELGDFLECYLDPDWVLRGRDAEDTWAYYLRYDPRTLADALVLYIKENK